MSDQAQGLSLVEKGFKEIIKAECRPELELLKKDIEDSKQQFSLVKKESNEALEKAENCCQRHDVRRNYESQNRINFEDRKSSNHVFKNWNNKTFPLST